MTNILCLLILFQKKIDPRLFLALSIKTFLIGIGLFLLAGYLTFKPPEEIKRHPRLSRLKDTDWGQYFAGGILFTSWGGVFIIKSLGELGRGVGEIEVGLVRGLLIVSLVAFVFLLVAKLIAKFRE